jgi:hypothetical protein
MRTTLDLEKPVLDALKELRRKEKRSLGQIASRLLADALSRELSGGKPVEPFEWETASMGAKVDLADKDAVYRVMGES